MSKKVIILKGLPASGKSTWAKAQLEKYPGRYKRVCKDDLRSMLDGSHWSKTNEKFVLQVRDSLILTALAEGYHALVDDTNLHSKHETAIRELVKGLATVEIQDFTDVPLEICIERDLHRLHSVGERVIRKMHRDFLQVPVPSLVYNHLLPDGIIVDLDGTLALLNGRNPYDTGQCENDALNKPVADIVMEFANPTCGILFTSGRKEQFREHTLRWLKQHGFDEQCTPFRLYMRPDDDNRKDAVVKREMYELYIAGRYNIKFVLDDRGQCINLWRSLGLTALQVADGDF